MAVIFLLMCMFVQLFALMPEGALAVDTDYNLGFESDMIGWTQHGGVTVETEMQIYEENADVPFTWTIKPHGTKMAVLYPSGDIVTPVELQATMGLSTSSLDYINSIFSSSGTSGKDITNMAYIYRDITLIAGQQISISWNYVATDYSPWNDGSLLCAANTIEPEKLPIINGYYSDVSILGATVPGKGGNYATGDYGSTGWQTATIKAAYAGTYRLGFVAFNLGDTILPPYLFVEDQAGTTLKDDVPFDPIPPDDNPPPMQPVQSLNYDVTLFHEADANDGSVTEKAVLTLTNAEFTGAVDSVISDVTFENTPAGLTPVVTKTSDQTAELTFTGKATAHLDSNNISNFRVIFGNGAFTAGEAAKVLGSDTAILGFDFFNPFFTVTFYDADGKVLSTQQIEEGDDAVPPNAPAKPGYAFTSWSAAYEEIESDVDLEAIYTANTDTPYSVEYYVPSEDGKGYVLKETFNVTGTTDSQASAQIKSYSGLMVDQSKSTLKGIVAADGSLVLKVYYQEEAGYADTGDRTNPWVFLLMLGFMGMALAMADSVRNYYLHRSRL